MVAASYGNRDELVRILLDEGADVNAQGGHFGTALLAAIHYQHHHVIQRLLLYGADASMPDDAGATPLHLGALLVKGGSDPQSRDRYGRCGLDWATNNSSVRSLIRDYWPNSTGTSEGVRMKALHSSICQLSERILASKQRRCSPAFVQLGNCLIQTQDYDGAIFASNSNR